jgi:RNA polymerase sigma factor (sigma-70 family)
MDTPHDDRRLFEDCLNDGSVAQVTAFETLWRYLYRIAYSMLHTRADGEALAADCAQLALVKIHRNLSQCRTPEAFRGWSAQILRRVVIDELRRPEIARRAELNENVGGPAQSDDMLGSIDADDLRTLLLTVIQRGPLSERSQRVVLGRYFDEQPDEALAQAESQLSGQIVLPSHIQVTRAKNLAKLRADSQLIERLRGFLG